MVSMKQNYLDQVKIALSGHPDTVEIYNEILAHINDGIHERMLSGKTEIQATEEMLQIMANPFELGKSYCQPLQKQKLTYLILLNWCFFIIGLFITICFHSTELAMIQQMWTLMVNESHYILLLYTTYWLYLGYATGKHYGPNGKKFVNKTMIKAYIPNLLLMMLVLFHVIPSNIFSPLLDPLFIGLCIIATVLFYPLSKLAFKIGIIYGL